MITDLIFKKSGSSCFGAAETNLTSTHEDAGSIPGLTQWVRESSITITITDSTQIPRCCGYGVGRQLQL